MVPGKATTVNTVLKRLEQECEKLGYEDGAIRCFQELWRPARACIEEYFGKFVIPPVLKADDKTFMRVYIADIEDDEIIWLGLRPGVGLGAMMEDFGLTPDIVPYLVFAITVHELFHLKQGEVQIRQYAAQRGITLTSQRGLSKCLGRGKQFLVRFLELTETLEAPDHLWKEGLAAWVDQYICDLLADISGNSRFTRGKEVHHSVLDLPWETERKRLSRVYYQDVQRAAGLPNPSRSEQDILRDFVRIVRETSEATSEKIYLRLFDVCTWRNIKKQLNRGMLYLHTPMLGMTSEELGGLFRNHWRKVYSWGAELTQRLYEHGGIEAVRQALCAAPADYERYVTEALVAAKEEFDLDTARQLAKQFCAYEIQTTRHDDGGM